MAASKTIVLVTGEATSGIGFELCAQLLSKGSYHVLVGARSSDKGSSALRQLQSREPSGSAEAVTLDVTDDATIEKAAHTVRDKFGHLDILVNNAGLGGLHSESIRVQMRDCFDANATGPAVIGNAFGPLLQKSAASPRIINISSGAGSIENCLDPSSKLYGVQQVQYRASKAALNMVTACQWVQYGPQVKVFAYCPGFTQSNLGPHNTAENGARPTEESVKSLVDVLEGKRDDEAGKFLHNTGTYSW